MSVHFLNPINTEIRVRGGQLELIPAVTRQTRSVSVIKICGFPPVSHFGQLIQLAYDFKYADFVVMLLMKAI